MQLERYGFLVLILLLMTGALGYILYPLSNKLSGEHGLLAGCTELTERPEKSL